MNKLVPIIVCFIMAFATIPGVNNTCRGGFEYRQEDENAEEIRVKEISSRWGQNSAFVTIEVMYEADATPPKTYYFTKTKWGVKHGGTLTLEGIRNRSDARYAIYSGYIYPIE